MRQDWFSESLAAFSAAGNSPLLDSAFEVLRTHEQLFWLLGLGSLALLVGTALLIPWLIILLPADFFARLPARPFQGRHPVIAILLIVFRNALGAVLLAAGVVMLFIPGQGLLTILIGLALIDFPGKHTLLIRLFSNPRVFNAANRIRRWAAKPDFVPAAPELSGDLPPGPPSQSRQGPARSD